jgi:hypothetical protein
MPGAAMFNINTGSTLTIKDQNELVLTWSRNNRLPAGKQDSFSATGWVTLGRFLSVSKELQVGAGADIKNSRLDFMGLGRMRFEYFDALGGVLFTESDKRRGFFTPTYLIGLEFFFGGRE